MAQTGRTVPEIGKAWVDGGNIVDDYSPAQLERFKTLQNLDALSRQGIVELDQNFNLRSVASGRQMMVNPREVRFTQEWVSYNSSDKVNTLDTTGPTVKTSTQSLPAIDVMVMPDGRLSSLDNRRLTAAQLYEADSIKVIIHAPGDALPDARTVRRFAWENYQPQTWGEAAAVRIYKQGSEFRDAFRQGSTVIPTVRNAPNSQLYSPLLVPPTRRR